MPELDFWLLIFVVPAIAFAGWVHGALGLGFPLVATPLIAIFVDVKAAILITLLPTATVNVASVLVAKDVKAVIMKQQPLMIASFIGAITGSIILAYAEGAPFGLGLAALIILFLVTTHFGLRLPITATTTFMVGFGLVAGVAAGTTNVMVAVLIIYFLSINADRSEMVPGMNLCFLIGKLSQIVVFLAVGLINVMWLVYTIPLAVVGYGALKLGQQYGATMAVDRYRVLLRWLLMVLALVLVVQYFWK